MRLTVGEISKVLGLTTENIRYYVREGLIKPEKSKENNYWEYSSEDVMYIYDILFYRSMGLSIDSIRKVFGGMPLERIQDWRRDYNRELQDMGKYRKGKMPPSLRVSSYQNDDEHIVRKDKDNVVHKYISVAKTEERVRNNRYLDIIEEPEKTCLITHTLYSDDVEGMIEPISRYAEDQGIMLTGEFYGRGTGCAPYTHL